MGKLKIILLSLVVFTALAAGGAMVVFQEAQKPADETDSTVVVYNLESGSTPTSVVSDLFELGLVKNETISNVLVRLNGWSLIQAGEYELTRQLTLEEMFEKFAVGEVLAPDEVRVAVPEGATLFEVAEGFATIVDLSKEQFLEASQDATLLNQFINDYWFLTEDAINPTLKHPLEGFIFPATYSFIADKTYTVEEVLTILLDVTASRLEPIKDDLQHVSLSIHEVFTLASIVEAETPNVTEMPTVAGVFFNRLARGQKLESCATIQYILDERVTHVTADMIAIDSPYNSYNSQGLPIGPVGSPSLEAIQAVINPDIHDYIFFIGDIYGCVDGKTHFFVTYEEHLAFYHQYLLPSYQAGENVCNVE